MLDKLKALSLKQQLAGVALLLGIVALLIGKVNLSGDVTLSPKELSYLVDQKTDHITVETLADWIITAKADFRLIDLNEKKDFDLYHIPGAENYNAQSILSAGLKRNEKIVLYSNGGIHSAQVWMLLKAKEYKNVYTLLGGLEEWKDGILFPRLSSDSTAEALKLNDRKKQIALFFGGQPVNGGDMATGTEVNMPKLPTPQGGGAAPAAGGKKKKEGC